jgi:REP element-mobilizing transposase RayT
MANTYTSLHYHVVFSTKHREALIAPAVEPRLWAYLGGIARENDMRPLCIGGVEDHVHLLLGLPPSLAVSKAVQLIKGGASKWVHDTFPELRTFAWQDGYGAFTLGKSQIPDTVAYIQKQREHHRARTFKDEYLAFLRKHEIEYDERYVFD